jgi:multidrug efflux pump subunit AcrB
MRAPDTPGNWSPGLALLRNRHLLVLAIILLLLSGFAAWTNLPRIEDPRVANRFALAITPYPGANAERVEALVTKKLEDAVREVPEVKNIDSTSSGNISSIAIELDDAVTAANNERIFSELRDKLSEAAAALPPGAGPTVLDSERGALAYSLIVAVGWSHERGDAAPLGILDRLAESLAERLRNLPGTEKVDRFGDAGEEIRVEANPEELAAIGLTLDQVAARLAGADVKDPAGTLYGPDHRLRLTLAGELDAVQRVSAVPLLAADGRVLSVGDVAEVRKTWREPPEQIASADGQRSVLLGVQTRAALDLAAWSKAAKARVEEFADNHSGGGISVSVLFEQSAYTNARLASLGGNLLAGALVVMLVVFVTMGWRSALIVGAALPLSAAITLLGLDVVGQQIHQITIFGMIIAIGLLIDNAIVVTDEVRKRLASGLPPAAAVHSGVRHLFGPLAASTFTTMLGFMPILLLPGNVGDFVGPIATSVILALAASFVIAMTIIPALAALAAPKGVDAPQRHRWWRDGLGSPGLASGYGAMLEALLRRPLLASGLCLILPAIGFVATGKLELQFFPPADRNQFEVQIWASGESSIERTAKAMHAIEAAIRSRGDVEQIFWVAGASSPPVYYNQLRLEENNPSYARATVTTIDTPEAERLVAELQQVLPDRFPDLRVVVRSFGQGPPISAPLSLRVLGPDPQQLRQIGDELRRTLHQLPEVTETKASIPGGIPRLTLVANEQEARLAGLSLGDIAAQYRTALEGAQGGRVLEDLEDLPVRVRWSDADRGDPARVATLPLLGTRPTPLPGLPEETAAWVPAAALGALQLEPEIPAITRRNGERVNNIDAWLRAGALPLEVTKTLRDEIERAGLVIPNGYRLEFAGDSEEQGEAIALLLAYAPLLGALMVATLVLAFRSFTLAALILLIGVLSVLLGMLALWLSGKPLGFNPILGSAGLIGVAINASIVVLAAIRADPGAAAGDVARIVVAVRDCTRHIVSTTLTTVGGFLPLILFASGDFWPPLAIVIAGGVGLSMPLGLVLTPALYRVLVKIRLVQNTAIGERSHLPSERLPAES